MQETIIKLLILFLASYIVHKLEMRKFPPDDDPPG